MLDQLRPVCAEPLPCKVCGGEAGLFGVVDFHKNCAEPKGVRLPLSGVPVYYRRCAKCGFLFTDAFDDWSSDQFKQHIYNDGYQAVDPDYQSARPRANAEVVTWLWATHKAETRVLDYGGGNDEFCTALRANDFPAAVTYDPLVPAYAHRPDGKFDLVTSFGRSNICRIRLPASPRSSNARLKPGLSSTQRWCSRRTSTITAYAGGMSGRATATCRSSANRRWPWPGVATVTERYRSMTASTSPFAPCRRFSPI